MNKIKSFYSDNKFLLCLFLFSFLIRLVTIIVIKTPVESDFKVMYDAALELISGTRNYVNNPYFIKWGYQVGHVLYQASLLKILNSIGFLKICNCLITSLIVVMVYLISAKITDKKYAKVSSALYAIFPFPMFLNAVLTNQHLPILLTLVAIYILININYDRVTLKSIVVGLLIGLGNILRSEGIVFIFSIFLYYIFLYFKKFNLKKLIGSFLLIIISYFLIFNCTSLILQKTNLSINGLKNMNPAWKFVLGFNYETNGMYSDSDASMYADSKEKSRDIAIERLQEYEHLPLLFLKKTKILWFNSDLDWSLGYIHNSLGYRIFNIINQLFICFFLFLSGISLINLIKNKFPNIQVLITIILAVYFGVYLLIEVMPRYAYSLQVFEAILVSVGLELICERIIKMTKKEVI